MWHRIDDEVLGVADDVVKWLWNEFGVTYKWVHRAASFMFIGANGSLDLLQKHHLGWGSIALYAFALVLALLNEWYIKTIPQDTLAGVVARGRTTLISRCIRLYIFGSLALDIFFTFVRPTMPYRFDVGHDLIDLFCLVLWVSLPALGPREPKRLLVPKLATIKL